MVAPDQADRNFRAFERLLPELIQSHPGKFAVLHDERVVDFFDTLGDAVKLGRVQFGQR